MRKNPAATRESKCTRRSCFEILVNISPLDSVKYCGTWIWAGLMHGAIADILLFLLELEKIILGMFV